MAIGTDDFFDRLNILSKFCYNRINEDRFFEYMEQMYSCTRSYSDSKYPAFRDHPLLFITSRGERKILELIERDIQKENYKG